MKTNLTVRFTSASIGLIILLSIAHFFQSEGLTYMCRILIYMGMVEFINVGIKPLNPPRCRLICLCFLLPSILLLEFILGYQKSPAPLALPLALLILGLSFQILLTHKQMKIKKIHSLITSSLLGIVYCSILPACILLTLTLETGVSWFFVLLNIVFWCDIFAYFSGRFFGKTPLSPLSPKKTLEGAFGGLVGSMFGAMIMHQLSFSELPIWWFLLTAALTSVIAQIGDLFESMIKRIANVKDSGRLMPGHGGILDRLDGIYFSAPLVYFFAIITPRLF